MAIHNDTSTTAPDPLEPYRRMARSIRFMPPIWHNLQPHLPPSSLQFRLPAIADRPKASVSLALESLSVSEPAIDPSVRVLTLIQAAVTRPTVLPVVYVIPENIGDRISRLAKPQPAQTPVAKSYDWGFKLPAPAIVEAASVADIPLDAPEAPAEPEVVSTVVQPLPIAAVLPDRPQTVQSEPQSEGVETAAEPIADQAVSDWLESVSTYLENVTHKLEENSQPSTPTAATTCPNCGSGETRKNGRRGGKQKYLCKQCNRQFTSSIEEVALPLRSAKSSSKKAKGFGSKTG